MDGCTTDKQHGTTKGISSGIMGCYNWQTNNVHQPGTVRIPAHVQLG